MLAQQLDDAFRLHANRHAVEVPSLAAQLRYDELRTAAAHWHASLGEIERPLVLYVDKGPTYYALLACMFLFSRSFCPIDRVNPHARVRRVCEELHGALVLTDDPTALAPLRDAGIDVVSIDQPDFAGIAPGEGYAPGRYYISTSGSTGRPKLVEVRHDAVVPLVEWAIPYFAIRPGDRWAQFSSIGFDLSIADAVYAWNAGATLVGTRTMAEVARLDRFASRNNLTHWHSVPSVVPYLARDGGASLTSLRVLAFCGEPLLRAHCERVRAAAPTARIVNTYGPTEGTLWCTYHEVTDADIADPTLPSMPIGHGVPGWNLTYLPAPDGARLVIVGDHLAEGYHGMHDAHFSHVEIAGRRMATFDTGDYFVFRNGRACFSHRADQMVKVNGNRVDVGDVTDACARAGVDQPVVVFDGTNLVLYVESDEPFDAAAVLATVRAQLPAYAVPTRVEVLARFPRTASGKIDRQSLVGR